MSLRPAANRPLRPSSKQDSAPPIGGAAFDEAPLTFDDLNPVEQAAASLGVQPDAIKPIGWLNDAHFQTLKDNNALHPDLSRRIEAFRHVSKATSSES
jgi:hypothetical protein